MNSDFQWRHFQGDIIPLAMRWHGRFGVSSRDLEQMMAERGISVAHKLTSQWTVALRRRRNASVPLA